MKKILTTVLSSALAFGLVGCSNITQQDVGTVAGGAIGGLLGSQFGGGGGQIAAAVGGTLIGAYIGGSIGKKMDQVDQMRMQQAIESNQVGQTSSWHNPDNGNSYKVTPTKTYYNNSQPCREYTTKAVIDGQTQVIHGRACRRADGKWHAVN